MSRHWRFLAALILCLTIGVMSFLSVGCASNRTLVGRWSSSQQFLGRSVTAEVKFEPGGAYSSNIVADGLIPSGSSLGLTGQYKILSEEKVRISVQGAEVLGAPIPISESIQDRALRAYATPRDYVIQWISQDRVNLVVPGRQALQLTRIK